MVKNSTIFIKTLVVGVIFLFVGICFMPTVNSIISKKDRLSYFQLDNFDLCVHLDEIQYDIKNTFNPWTYNPQTLSNVHKKIDYQIKSNEPKQGKKSSTQTSNGNTLYVGGYGPDNYTRIKDAIEVASDGDTVFVYDDSSPYYEWDIYLSKSINLIGENRETTIIDGSRIWKNWLGHGIEVSADRVTISGFTIQNFVVDDIFIVPGIWIHSSNNIITGNKVINNTNGIVLDGRYRPVNYNTVTNNIINSNSQCGVYFLSSINNIISMNTFSDNYYYGGLSLHTSRNNIISNNVFYNDGVWTYISYKNTFFNNSVNDKSIVYLEEESDKVIEEDAGQVILIKCDNITVQNQDISNSTIGLNLDQTNNCLISNNKISSHYYSGILLDHSFNNNISMNIFSNEDLGILLYYSNGNNIFSNTIKSSSWFGILMGYSNYNNILLNSFFDNNGGLSLDNSNNNNVLDNVFYNDGIFVYNAWKNIFQNNYVNEKPIVYLEDQSDILIDETAGQIFLLNCDNITVHNQEISNVFVGILLTNSDDCHISDNIITSNINYGIFLTHSSSNNISLNKLSDNPYGITLDTSHENIIFRNNINSNKVYGIWLSDSNYNMIYHNIIKKNGGRRWIGIGRGLDLAWSSNNEIHYNNFLGNAYAAYFAESSSNNWDFNYWNRPRLLPKIIIGGVSSLLFRIRINIDKHPAKKPYII